MGELEDYETQLEDIEEGLLADPENETFKQLKEELEQVISLLKEAEPEAQPEVKAEVSPPTKAETEQGPKGGAKDGEKPFAVGDSVFVKVKNAYKAGKIIQISNNNKLYTIKVDKLTEMFRKEEMFRFNPEPKLEEPAKDSGKEHGNAVDLNKSVSNWKNFSKKIKKPSASVMNKSKRSVTEIKKKEKNQRFAPY